MIAIEGASKNKLSAFKWIIKEQQFSACYMIGFSLVLAQSKPQEEQSSFALNVAFHIFKKLFAQDEIDLSIEDKKRITESFYEYVFAVDVNDDENAFELGIADAQKILNENMKLPRGLISHLERQYEAK